MKDVIASIAKFEEILALASVNPAEINRNSNFDSHIRQVHL